MRKRIHAAFPTSSQARHIGAAPGASLFGQGEIKGEAMMNKIKMLALVGLAGLVAVGTSLAEKKKKDMGKMDPIMKKMMMAMENMDRMMPMMMSEPEKAMAYMMEKGQASVERGKRHFNDPKLGGATMEVSCNHCHPGGTTTGGKVETPMPSAKTGKPYQLDVPTRVGSAATFPKYKVPNDEVVDLVQMDNNCLMMFVGGKPLAHDSQTARDIAAYIASLK